MVKTKIKKYKGWIRLVVDDLAINKLYECSQKEPVVLATMSNFFDSGCWSVEDFRISQYRTPSQYFEGSDACMYEVKSEEAKAKLVARLHTYREVESHGKKYITWNTFDKALLDGDNPSCKDKYGYEQNIIASFSYKAAVEKFNEIKEYWNNFEGTDLMQSKLPNPNRQISEMALIIEEVMEEEKVAKKPKVKK